MTTDRITRRTALKFSGVISLAATGLHAFPHESRPHGVRGYGRDPNLLRRTVTWPRTLTASQLIALAALCDIVLPADPPHPSAAAIGVHVFLDEWMSAPYPQMQEDRGLILPGLSALNEAMEQTRGISFVTATLSQKTSVFDEFCSADSENRHFSRRLIQLVCGGYYTTREGLAAIGYVGNVALTSFPGPAADVVTYLHEALNKLCVEPCN